MPFSIKGLAKDKTIKLIKESRSVTFRGAVKLFIESFCFRLRTHNEFGNYLVKSLKADIQRQAQRR